MLFYVQLCHSRSSFVVLGSNLPFILLVSMKLNTSHVLESIGLTILSFKIPGVVPMLKTRCDYKVKKFAYQ